MTELEQQIRQLWEHRDDRTAVMAESEARDAIYAAIDLLDRGEARVAEPAGEQVVVHEWLKQAILLLFRISKMETIELGPFEYADKIPLKHNYEEAGVRVVPGGSARWGSYVGRGAILMPSYVAYRPPATRRGEAHSRLPGPPSARARRSARACTFPAESVSAVSSSPRRRPRSSSATTRSSGAAA